MLTAALVATTFATPVASAVLEDLRAEARAVPTLAAAAPAPMVRLVVPPTEPEPTPEPEPVRSPKPEPEPAPKPEIVSTPKPTPASAPAVDPDEPAFDVVPTPAPPVADAAPSAPPEAAPPTRRPKASLRRLLAKAQGAQRASGDDASSSRRARRCEHAEDGIEQLDDHTWQISRALIKEHTRTLKQLNALGWSHAYRDDDAGVRGWRIGGFGCRSPLHAGGLRHKDVVRSVNGKPTNTVLQLFGLWTTWGRTDLFEVVVWRRGKEVVLRYKLV